MCDKVAIFDWLEESTVATSTGVLFPEFNVVYRGIVGFLPHPGRHLRISELASQLPINQAAAAERLSPMPMIQNDNMSFNGNCLTELAPVLFRSDALGRRLSASWCDPVQLRQRVAAWEHLSRNAVWRNLSFEHNYLIPALDHLASSSIRVLVVEDESADAQRNIVGLAPFEFKRIYGLPFKCAEIWKHQQCFDATPLLLDQCADEAWRLMCEAVAADGHSLLSLNTVSATSEFEHILNAVQRDLNLFRFQRDQYCRAAFLPGASAENYCRNFVSKSIQKNLRRLTRRLAEIGDIRFERSDDLSDFEHLANEFLRIESTGWKGRDGTALASDPATRQFFMALIRSSSAADKARFLTLYLDDQPIAMLSDIVSGSILYSYKTAYDESLAKYSPGLQVEMKNIEYLHQEGILFGDSCTASDNATINRIWGQRIAFQDVIFGLKPGPARIALQMLPAAQSMVQKFRQRRQGE